jgi:hypothetical protein
MDLLKILVIPAQAEIEGMGPRLRGDDTVYDAG